MTESKATQSQMKLFFSCLIESLKSQLPVTVLMKYLDRLAITFIIT